MMKMKNVYIIGVLVIMMAFFCDIAMAAPKLTPVTITGFGSEISLKLPGELVKADTPLPDGMKAKPFIKGEQLYQEQDKYLSLLVYTMSADIQEDSGSADLEAPMAAFADDVLKSLKASNSTVTKEEITLSGTKAAVDTLTFFSEGANMSMKIIAFQDKNAYWILMPIYQANNQKEEQLVAKVVKSIKIKP